LAEIVLPVKAPPRLDVDLRHRIGSLHVDVKFSLTQPWTIVFGPSGSGKTTILRAIAGLIRPDSGSVAISGDYSDGRPTNAAYVDASAGVFVESHRRHIPLAAQKANLFPHMTVREQIEYGICEAAKTGDLLGLFRIEKLADKLPHALSGGEAQRVNLARAAASASHMLLLDEPFTGLDPALRSEILNDLQAWAVERHLCILSVTHDVAEAFLLDAEVIKLAEGRVVQQGPVASVLAEERARLLEQLRPSE
jgi:molybdate transport system ATP-binding protein